MNDTLLYSFLYMNNIEPLRKLPKTGMDDSYDHYSVCMCISNTGEPTYLHNIDIAYSCLSTGVFTDVFVLPPCKFLLPSGIPVYDAFDLQLTKNETGFDMEINCANLACLDYSAAVTCGNEAAHNCDKLYFEIIERDIMYDYECKLKSVEDFFRKADFRHFKKAYDFVVLRVCLVGDRLYYLGCATSQEEALSKHFVFKEKR